METNTIVLKSEERVLFIINDNIIRGSTRFQKYGFLLFKQYQKELTKLKKTYPTFNFYDDWIPHHFGPYSKQLNQDIDECITDEILAKKIIDKERNYNQYTLTLKGRTKWRKLFYNTTDEMMKINDKIRQLQTMNFIEMLKQIYEAYPKYTVNSTIKNSLD